MRGAGTQVLYCERLVLQLVLKQEQVRNRFGNSVAFGWNPFSFSVPAPPVVTHPPQLTVCCTASCTRAAVESSHLLPDRTFIAAKKTLIPAWTIASF